jgi:hypothetical protein
MTSTHPSARAVVPELGSSLGRLCSRLEARPDPARWVRLDDLRLDLATRIFELAGAARAFAAEDDRAAAVSSLNRQAWLAEWERTVSEAAGRLGGAVEARLTAAAAEARLPKRLRRALPLTEADRRAISARLGSGSLAFLHSLEILEHTVPAASAAGVRGEAGLVEWQEALLGVARRLESAWVALEAAALAEQRWWEPEIERVRGWHRPTWPAWTLTAVALAIAAYFGLLFGGYLPVPGVLRPLAEAWWNRLP